MDVFLYLHAPRFPKKHPFCCNVPRFHPFVLLLIVALMIKWRWLWSNGGMILPGENRSTWRKTGLNVTLPTKNTTEIVICLNNTFNFNSYLTENTVCIDLEGNQLMLLREKIGIYLKIIWNTQIHYVRKMKFLYVNSGWYGELPQEFASLTAERNRKNDLWSKHLLGLLLM